MFCKFVKSLAWKYIWGIPLGILLAPVLINAYVKYMMENSGYTAGDILCFIGAFASAGATVVISILTINFTRRQIASQAFFEKEKEKWRKIEKIVSDSLVKVNPLNLYFISVSMDLKATQRTIDEINKYRLDCSTACDSFAAYVSIEDYPKIKAIVDNIANNCAIFCVTADKINYEYQNVLRLIRRDCVVGLLQVERKYPGSISQEVLIEYDNIIKQAGGLSIEGVMQNVGSLRLELNLLYETNYKKLLALKGQVFSGIMDELENKRIEMLEG